MVKDIMIKNVRTIGQEERIALARIGMLRYGVGGLPVVDDDNKLIGILTLRDIGLVGTGVMSLAVKHIMTKENLITAFETNTLLDVADIMSKTGIQRIPIVDDKGKIVGLVTQSVVIRAFLSLFK